ncbi:MAG: phosphoribosylanthranilate isomerase [Candidatus Omnitrophica bacterium]|nr:phosphoribosylanthranilate isomerase [Candidatus Omnitrophota bacterium]
MRVAKPIWVKICGITNRKDSLAAAEAGADAVGFIFVPASPRAVTREVVSEILPSLPPTVLTVAVVANESPEFIQGLLRVCPLKGIQFHGEETPEEVLRFKGQVRLIKAIRVQDTQSLEQIPRFQGVDAIVLDACQPGARGGTGTPFDWQLAVQAKAHGIPVIVAGGLNPQNVADAVTQVRPYGVDVTSGVELSPGRKDPALIREFVLRAKQAVSA